MIKESVLDKYIPEEIEGRIYSFWTDKGLFKADENSVKPPFSVVIPPPNVTGSLHMGHALNNTLQDILCRYKRARGFNVLWVPGCDHAGIATQNVVERELKKEGKKRHDLGREKFVERVWEWKEKYGTTIMMQLRKLGSSLDWSRERFTMDEGLSEAVKEVFVRLYNEKLIYRGDYIINWCPRCHTALSDIEVEHKDLDGNFYHIKYPYKDKPGFIQVATTRPETLLGDTAVAVHPDDPRYKDIPEGTLVLLPETGRAIPIIKDEYVDKEFGTGAVKITPAHDPNDFLVGLKHKLEMIKVMDESAKMNENAGDKYKGMDRFEARKKIMEELEAQGLVVKTEPHKHAVGHCYRCNTVIEPYISTQWFVKIKP
ncbi:MAG TPA: class I tRNA ligase family protein, partial [Candidatus Goldiibacteriota bacterium]|nr:class I tRNA ligase family protein [Candidatus Goldiibacteriota bacterium]